MQFLAVSFLAAWLYSMGSLVYFPIKLVAMRRRAADVWTFFTRRRLLLSALAYFMAAPFLGFLAIAASAGGVSGSNASGVPDSIETLGWALCFMFLAAAVLSLLFAFLRPPKNDAQKAVVA